MILRSAGTSVKPTTWASAFRNPPGAALDVRALGLDPGHGARRAVLEMISTAGIRELCFPISPFDLRDNLPHRQRPMHYLRLRPP